MRVCGSLMLVSPLPDHWVIEMSLRWRYNSHRKTIFGENLMKVNRLADLQEYEAPGHFDMKGFRLQGFDASDSKNFWTGLSYFLPGGGTTHTATPWKKSMWASRVISPSSRKIVRRHWDISTRSILRLMRVGPSSTEPTRLPQSGELCPIHQTIDGTPFPGTYQPIESNAEPN